MEIVELCLLWLWRSFLKSKNITPDNVIVMSSGLSKLEMIFLIKSLRNKLGIWSSKDVGIYQAGRV